MNKVGVIAKGRGHAPLITTGVWVVVIVVCAGLGAWIIPVGSALAPGDTGSGGWDPWVAWRDSLFSAGSGQEEWVRRLSWLDAVRKGEQPVTEALWQEDTTFWWRFFVCEQVVVRNVSLDSCYIWLPLAYLRLFLRYGGDRLHALAMRAVTLLRLQGGAMQWRHRPSWKRWVWTVAVAAWVVGDTVTAREIALTLWRMDPEDSVNRALVAFIGHAVGWEGFLPDSEADTTFVRGGVGRQQLQWIVNLLLRHSTARNPETFVPSADVTLNASEDSGKVEKSGSHALRQEAQTEENE